jgi:hypothetical protein
VIETKAPPPDEFAGEEYGEDWEWPDLPPLVLSETALTLGAGESASLTAEINGAPVPAASLRWTLNKTGVVGINEETGEVTVLGPGNAVIKAKAPEGQTAKCTVTTTVELEAGLYVGEETTPQDLTDTIGANLLVKSFAWIKKNSHAGDSYTIVLDEDITISSSSAIFIGEYESHGFIIGTGGSTNSSTGAANNNKNLKITLKGAGGTRTIKIDSANSYEGTIFYIYGNATDDTPHLVLGENITLQGHDENGFSLVEIGSARINKSKGKLTMTAGSRITGNVNLYENGGGVYVRSDCEFTMDGGAIDNNEAIDPEEYGNGTGGGVFVAGTFVMNGGSIKENSAKANGGGVLISAAATSFTMTSGTIEGNTAGEKGAAVFKASSTGTFNKTGGVIYGINAGEKSNKKTESVYVTVHSIEMKSSTPWYYDETAGADVALAYTADDTETNTSNWSKSQ